MKPFKYLPKALQTLLLAMQLFLLSLSLDEVLKSTWGLVTEASRITSTTSALLCRGSR